MNIIWKMSLSRSFYSNITINKRSKTIMNQEEEIYKTGNWFSIEPQTEYEEQNSKTKKKQLKINLVETDLYFREMQLLEMIYKIDENILVGHGVTPRMRAILINWLFEIEVDLKLLSSTVHLAVGIIDRYLQINKKIGKDRLQLLGIVALIIADRLDETFVLNTTIAINLCGGVFTEADVTTMESSIFQKLDSKFERPISLHFVRRYRALCYTEKKPYFFALYLLDLALINTNLSFIRPSLQAAAAIYLAMTVFKQKSNTIWRGRLFKYSDYTTNDILPICELMAKSVLVSEKSRFQSVRNKFLAEMYESVSNASEIKSKVIKNFAKKIN